MVPLRGQGWEDREKHAGSYLLLNGHLAGCKHPESAPGRGHCQAEAWDLDFSLPTSAAQVGMAMLARGHVSGLVFALSSGWETKWDWARPVGGFLPLPPSYSIRSKPHVVKETRAGRNLRNGRVVISSLSVQMRNKGLKTLDSPQFPCHPAWLVQAQWQWREVKELET